MLLYWWLRRPKNAGYGAAWSKDLYAVNRTDRLLIKPDILTS
jgi:hypothetical protein